MAITGIAGETQDFAYRGSVEPYTIPVGGVYKLEVWGASGGTYAHPYLDMHRGAGGAGGYSAGYKILNAETVIYVCVGGAGRGNGSGYLGESYNGGGAPGAGGGGAIYGGASGGGATHIAAMTGTLAQIGEENLDKIYIVAGGGGGGGHNVSSVVGAHAGGKGGGASGTSGGGSDGGSGGTQAQGGSGYRSGSFGMGGTGAATGVTGGDGAGSGGGGGLYGGGGRNAGGGGSGYIGGVPGFSIGAQDYQPTTEQGGNSGAGKARLTYMGPAFIPVYFDGTHLQHVVFNGTKLEHLIYNGQNIFSERLLREMNRRMERMRRGGTRPCLT